MSWRARIAVGVSALLLAGAAGSESASATIIPAACMGTTGDAHSLKLAIVEANTDFTPDTVRLGHRCRYTLTQPDNYWYGANGLPPISTDVTIDGNGGTVARSASAPPLRFFFVGAIS